MCRGHAARRSYTQAWAGGHDSLYAVLNRTLGAEKREGLIAWFCYLKLFLTCLAEEPHFVGTLYRGVNIRPVRHRLSSPPPPPIKQTHTRARAPTASQVRARRPRV